MTNSILFVVEVGARNKSRCENDNFISLDMRVLVLFVVSVVDRFHKSRIAKDMLAVLCPRGRLPFQEAEPFSASKTCDANHNIPQSKEKTKEASGEEF